jgi:hypothetical protein
MAVISRSQLLKELLPGLNALFGMEYNRYESEHEELYDMEGSERSFEEEVKLGGFDMAPVKAEGTSIVYDQAQEAWTARYTHETIALGFSITEEAMEDNLYDTLSARYSKALGRSMAHTKQVKAAFPFNNAYSGSGLLGGDGVTLCASNHSLLSGGTQKNMLTVAADLNETSLEQACIDIYGFVDERGLIIAARPVKLCIPSGQQFVATRILESQLRTNSADNDINAIYNNGTLPGGYSVNHYFIDTKNWFVKTDCPNGMKGFNRVPLQTSMDGDFDTGNVRYKARERYSFGWSDPLGVFGSGDIT